jgi:excisionase family DNA binding protein
MQPLLTEDQLAELTAVPVKTLQRWRSDGTGGPRYVKAGRAVRYRPEDVEQWLDRSTVRPAP